MKELIETTNSAGEIVEAINQAIEATTSADVGGDKFVQHDYKLVTPDPKISCKAVYGKDTDGYKKCLAMLGVDK